MPNEIAAILVFVPTIAHEVYLRNVNIRQALAVHRYLFSPQSAPAEISLVSNCSAVTDAAL